MRQRCNNPHNPKYHRYGGRGIKVCNRWNDFNNFYNDIGNIPPYYQLDRINNNGNYEPSNVRITSNKINALNTSKTRLWIINNKKFLGLEDAAKYYNVGISTIRRWCMGFFDNKNNKFYPSKAGCKSILLYSK